MSITSEPQIDVQRTQRAGPGTAFMRPLRVLHVTNVEKENYYLNNLVDYTDRREVEHMALTFGARGGFVEQLERRGIRAYALNCLSRRRYFQVARELWQLIERERIDIVHTHLFDPTVIGLIVGRVRGRRVVVTRHHSDALYKLPGKVRRQSYLLLEKLINRYAHHIIAPSRMVRDILVDWENVPASKVSLIPYGQTAEQFDSITPEMVAGVRRELHMSDRLAIVCTSRLYKRKGHEYLFTAFAGLISEGLDATLYLVGAGEERERLERLTREMGIADRVRFLGWRDDARVIIAAADLIVHPSLEDALSSALIESVMLERPIVAADISGVRDILGADEYGLIVPPADAEALRAALAQTINNLDAARARARRGRKFLLQYMDAGDVARNYVACYERVIQPTSASLVGGTQRV